MQVSLALGIALTPLLAACQPLAAPPALVSRHAVEVASDPRIELMSVVQTLSGYFLVTGHDLAYKAEVQRRFGPWANHRAVTLFKEMSRGDFQFSTVPEAMVPFGPPPGLAQRLPIRPEIAAAAGGEARMLEWVAALRDFARVSRFGEFYRGKRGYYDQLASAARPVVQPVIGSLNAYTGIPLSGARVVLGPLLHDGGFATRYELPGGGEEAYAFIGPAAAVAGKPDFGSSERIEGLVAHEFAHLVINPMTERHGSQVDRYAGQFPAIAEAMRRRGYSHWRTVVNEQVIRAITTRLATRARGEAAGQQALKQELEWGYAYVPALMDKLKVYEANRSRYRTLEDFYPQLLAAFAETPRAAAP